MQTGFPILDRMTGSFGKGDLITLVGGPLVGRSMFAMNILHNQMGFETPPKIAFMTAELTAEEAERKLFQLAEDDAEEDRMKRNYVFIDILKYCLDYDSLQAKIAQVAKEQSTEAVVIDSFHFLPFLDNYSYDKMPNISRRLKFLARELGIVIIITTRTNYQPSNRDGLNGHRPQLSDLEYIGDLHYFSDVVLGMTRPEMDDLMIDVEGNSLERIIQIEILKSRKTIRQIISYQITSDKGLIEEMGLLDRRNWMW